MARVKYQKRHFEQFARMVLAMRADMPGLYSEVYLESFTDRLVGTFSRDNPRFNRKRFLQACGDPRAGRTPSDPKGTA